MRFASDRRRMTVVRVLADQAHTITKGAPVCPSGNIIPLFTRIAWPSGAGRPPIDGPASLSRPRLPAACWYPPEAAHDVPGRTLRQSSTDAPIF